MSNAKNRNFAVIGLGAFGSTLARSLAEEGANVTAVDNNMDHLDEIKDIVRDTICFDATDPELLKEHGLTEVDVAIVAIGESFKPVVLIAMELLSAGVNQVYGRAGSETEEKILRRIGITDVIHPERQVAERMGVSLMRRGMKDVFEVGGGLAIFEVEAPESFVGYSLADLDLRNRFEVNLITIKRPIEGDDPNKEEATVDDSEGNGEPEEVEFTPIGIVTAQTKIKEGDQLVLVGTKDNIDKLLDVG